MALLRRQERAPSWAAHDEPRLRHAVALHGQCPAVRLDDLSRDRQTQARAARLGREERVKDALRISGGMPTPRFSMSTRTARRRTTPPARGPCHLRRRLERVLDQFGEHLGKPEGVTPDRRHGAGRHLDYRRGIARQYGHELVERLRKGHGLPVSGSGWESVNRFSTSRFWRSTPISTRSILPALVTRGRSACKSSSILGSRAACGSRGRCARPCRRETPAGRLGGSPRGCAASRRRHE